MILGLFFIVYFAGWYFAVEKGIDYRCATDTTEKCYQLQETSFVERANAAVLAGILAPFGVAYQLVFK